MIRRMALAFIGVLWANAASAQVPCSQCQQQDVQCHQQATSAYNSCTTPYYNDFQNCVSYALGVQANCYAQYPIQWWMCDWQYDYYYNQCYAQYFQDIQYCESAYSANQQGCRNQYDACAATCTNDIASLSSVSGEVASAWAATPVAPAACVDVSVSERAPTIATSAALM